MSLPELLDSLLNFVAPAFFVALASALTARWMFRRDADAPGFWMQAALNFVVGVAALAAGLWYFGRDGMMASYITLVLVCGSVQWMAARGYRN